MVARGAAAVFAGGMPVPVGTTREGDGLQAESRRIILVIARQKKVRGEAEIHWR